MKIRTWMFSLIALVGLGLFLSGALARRLTSPEKLYSRIPKVSLPATQSLENELNKVWG